MIKIKKLDYSSKPWRFVDTTTGEEIWSELPGTDGCTYPVCFNTKKEAIEALGSLCFVLLELVAEKLNSDE